ncbi:MAG: TetR/AcrR family transcriptional regulator [Microbacter sp.]
MTGQRTREMLVEVARMLFAQWGKDKTTMNDIANASSKGRRTLYSYFQSKDEIYSAVIEQELHLLDEKLQKVVSREMPADQKLAEYIFTRLDAVKESITRNGSLKADFFRDIQEVERVRRRFDVKDIQMLQQIFEEGKQNGYFNLHDTELSAQLFHYALRGIEAPYVSNKLSDRMKYNKRFIINAFMRGILVKKDVKHSSLSMA